MDIFNQDFSDFIASLNAYDVHYVLIGGYAVVIRGYSRSTGDMDIWVEKTSQNYTKLMTAFYHFGLPTSAISLEQFLGNENDVFSFGREPSAIDILTRVKGLDFSETWQNATWEQLDNCTVKVIHIKQLIQAKIAAGRFKDLNDLENLPPN